MTLDKWSNFALDLRLWQTGTMLATMPAARLLPALLLVAACAANKPDAKNPADAAKKEKEAEPKGNAPEPMNADRSRCDKRGKRIVEFDLNHDGKADVWKYWIAADANRADTLACKEIDGNFDGRLDMWIYYDDAQNITL